MNSHSLFVHHQPIFQIQLDIGATRVGVAVTTRGLLLGVRREGRRKVIVIGVYED